MKVVKRTLHPILTAETHNFPSAVAPFPGAETGTGGRLRDVMATGQGAYPVAGICAYCVGNLQIPGYKLLWEDKTFEYPLSSSEARATASVSEEVPRVLVCSRPRMRLSISTPCSAEMPRWRTG